MIVRPDKWERRYLLRVNTRIKINGCLWHRLVAKNWCNIRSPKKLSRNISSKIYNGRPSSRIALSSIGVKTPERHSSVLSYWKLGKYSKRNNKTVCQLVKPQKNKLICWFIPNIFSNYMSRTLSISWPSWINWPYLKGSLKGSTCWLKNLDSFQSQKTWSVTIRTKEEKHGLMRIFVWIGCK